MSEIVVIIGNGFDLNLGLETSYTDFLRSTQYKKLIDQENSLAEHLIKKHDLQNWIDIENELKKYSNDFFKNDNRTDFKKEYLSLCSALCDYINNLDYSTIDKSSFAYKFGKKCAKKTMK